MEANNGVEAFYAKTRQQWRKWLEKNGQKKKEICLIVYHKKSKTPSVSYDEAVEEALCFGWIDSKANKRDSESFYQRFSPRKPNGNWSARNIERGERMIREGLMTEHGMKFVDIAREKGKW
jgi:uncharacterized protein YdeI (YjbR/CyaY-like superfamily)